MGHGPINPESILNPMGPLIEQSPQSPLKILLFDSSGEKVDFDVISLHLCAFWGMPLTLQHPDFGSIKF